MWTNTTYTEMADGRDGPVCFRCGTPPAENVMYFQCRRCTDLTYCEGCLLDSPNCLVCDQKEQQAAAPPADAAAGAQGDQLNQEGDAAPEDEHMAMDMDPTACR